MRRIARLNPVVLDTSVASFALNGDSRLAPYRPHLDGAGWVVCFQTVAELRFGALNAGWGVRRRGSLERFLASLTVVDSSDDLATLWADLRDFAQRAGRRLEAGDAWIAAAARYLGAPLLTHDRDFSPAACPSIIVYCYA